MRNVSGKMSNVDLFLRWQGIVFENPQSTLAATVEITLKFAQAKQKLTAFPVEFIVGPLAIVLLN